MGSCCRKAELLAEAVGAEWVAVDHEWSITLHVGLIVLLLATYKAATQFIRVVQEQIIIPDASLVTDPGGIPNPGLGNDPTRSQWAGD